MKTKFERSAAYEKHMRQKHNLNGLTGRFHGDFFQNGAIRQGGVTPDRSTVFYEAIQEPVEHVINVLGLSTDGTKVPYEQLKPAVRPIKFKL